MARERKRTAPRRDGGRLRGLRDGRLSYGTPVAVGDRTVITVSRVRAQLAGSDAAVDSEPVGFIEITSQGSAFHPIDTGRDGRRALRAAAAAVTTVVASVAGARALRASRRSPRLLPPGRSR